MCTLFKMNATVAEMARLFRAEPGRHDNLKAYPEIYPGREAPVVVGGGEGAARRIELMQWGFPPPGDVKAPVVNVRNLASPFWRGWLSRPAQRCLVPVTEFCEWTAVPDPATGRKAKVWFGVTDAPLFAFAGLWRPGFGSDEEPRMAFLTCAPNRIVGAVHPKAMPVILAPDDYDAWLTGDTVTAEALQQPYPDAMMEIVAG